MKQNNFFTRLCMNFTVSVLLISLLGYVIGDMAKEVSHLFLLGSEGLSYASMIQILLLSVLVTFYDQLLFHSAKMENQMFLQKSIWMFLLSGGTTLLFVLWFHWFSVTAVGGWIGFLISFIVCFLMGG